MSTIMSLPSFNGISFYDLHQSLKKRTEAVSVPPSQMSWVRFLLFQSVFAKASLCTTVYWLDSIDTNLTLFCQSNPLLATIHIIQPKLGCNLAPNWMHRGRLNKFRPQVCGLSLYCTLLYPCTLLLLLHPVVCTLLYTCTLAHWHSAAPVGGELGPEMSSYSPLNGTLDSTFACHFSHWQRQLLSS